MNDKPTPTSAKLAAQLSAQLNQFGEAQLAEVSTRELRASTVHLILATAFFTGATIGLAKQSNTPRKIYLRTLRTFLETHFGLNADHAAGLVKSNARLYRRYVLVELVYNAGWLSSSEWCKQASTSGDELKLLLNKYQNLSMNGLGVEGTKEKTVEPAEVEATVAVKKTPIVETSPAPSRRLMVVLLLLLLFSSAAYLILYTDQLSTRFPLLKPALQSTLNHFFQFTDQLIKRLSEIVSNINKQLPFIP